MVCVQFKILYSLVCMQILLEELPVDVAKGSEHSGPWGIPATVE